MSKPIVAVLFGCVLLASPASAQETDRLTITQWVHPATPGAFEAIVVANEPGGGQRAIRKARVMMQGPGGVVHRGETDRLGRVLMSGVEPGIYAMSAKAPGYFACYAMHVIGPDHEGAEMYPTYAEISCAPLSFRTFDATIKPDFASQYSRDVLTMKEAKLPVLHGHVRGNELRSVMRVNGGLTGYVYAATHWGEMLDDEDLDHRLDPADNMKVYLFMNQSMVTMGITDKDGRFVFPSVDAGVYSILAVGPHGVGAVGFELVDPLPQPGNVQLSTDDGLRYVAMLQGEDNGQGEFAFQSIPMTGEELEEVENDGQETEDTTEPPVEEMTQTTGGGTGGGPGGGGGGGGGGGAGVGGLAAAAAAIGAAAGGGGGGGGFGGVIVPPGAASPAEPEPEVE